MPYVLSYLLCILPRCIHIISSAPKFTVAVFILQFRKLFIKHQTAFSFQISHETRYRTLVVSLRAYECDLGILLLLQFLSFSNRRVSVKSPLFLFVFFHRILFADILGQTLCDICNSNSYEINYLRHASWMTSLCFFGAVGRPHLYFKQREFFCLHLRH